MRYVLIRDLKMSVSDIAGLPYIECIELISFMNEDNKKEEERRKQAEIQASQEQ
jgi:hypothetical protein